MKKVKILLTAVLFYNSNRTIMHQEKEKMAVSPRRFNCYFFLIWWCHGFWNYLLV